jgi:hypothetical protein
MSGYQYEASKAERRAAELLRKKGWRVDEPLCPECHGLGFVWHGETWGDGILGGGSLGTRPCSRGCLAPALFFPAWPTMRQSRTVVHDSTPCTCPRGNYTGDWICLRHNPPNTSTGFTINS